MSDDKLDFLDGQPAEAPEQPQAEPVVLKEPEADKGEAAPAAPSAPPAEPAKEQHVAPLTALLDEREKRQAAERDLQEIRRRLQQQEAQARVQAPDPRQDPDGALEFERQRFQQQLYNTRLSTSRFFAEQQYGEDTVAEAFAFFDKNPALSHQFVDHPSPFHAAVEFYKRQKVADEVGADPVAYRAKLEAEIREKLMAEMQSAHPAQPKPRLPGSLAAAPAAGGAGEPGPKGSAFDAAFG